MSDDETSEPQAPEQEPVVAYLLTTDQLDLLVSAIVEQVTGQVTARLVAVLPTLLSQLLPATRPEPRDPLAVQRSWLEVNQPR